jgi:hypothetical protein
MTANRKTPTDAVCEDAMMTERMQDPASTATVSDEANGSRFSDMGTKAGSALSDVKDTLVSGAGTAASNLRDMAVEKADSARETLSDVGARLAATLERSVGEEEARDGLKSQLIGTVADGLGRMSEGLRQRSVTELADDMRLMARRHPGAFMAAAALAGFAAARFMRSSARHHVSYDAHDSYRGPRA